MEQKLKNLLGEYAFSIAILQHQIETLTKENEALKEKVNEDESDRT